MFSSSDAPPGNAGVYLGVITHIEDTLAYVEVPRLAPGFEYPARFPAELADTDTLTAGDHTHPGAAVQAGGAHTPTASTSSAGDHTHTLTATGDHTHTTPAGAVTGSTGTDDNVAVIDHTHPAGGLTAPAGTTGPAGGHTHPVDPAGAHTHPVTVDAVPAHSHGFTAAGSAGAHVHRLRPLAAGDEVAVAFLEGGRDELVVLLRLA